MSDSNSNPRQIIAEQNDRFRRTCGLPLSREARGVPGQTVITAGIAALAPEKQGEIVEAVMAFDSFTEANDPYGEHDFGRIDIDGVGPIFWKFDYYDQDLAYGSEDPSDLAQTMRVLTIMLAGEY